MNCSLHVCSVDEWFWLHICDGQRCLALHLNLELHDYQCVNQSEFVQEAARLNSLRSWI